MRRPDPGASRPRRFRVIAGLLALAIAATPAVVVHAATAQAGTPLASENAATTPELTEDTFADPPAQARPKYRWWLPLAYTDDQELAAELAQMKQIGAGGAEVAAFNVEGSGNNTTPFLSTYGWGTPLWSQKVATMLSAAKTNGLSLDFTIGPRWPATVPTVSDVNDPRAAQQIVFSYEFRSGGTTRSGPLPINYDTAPPAGAHKTLIAALVAKCTDAGCAKQASPRALDKSSVIDVTSKVDADGNLSVDLPGDAGSTYALIAFYQTPTGQSLSGYTATGTNYALDTLSEAGAEATTDFYDDNILTPDVKSLLDQMGTAELFEDSLELGSTQKWTSDFVAEWTKRRGYSPIDVLPALAGLSSQGLPTTAPAQPFFDFADGVGARVRTDYRQTLSDLYIVNRLDVLREWTHRHNMKTRIQPYGVPVDISAAAGHVDVPEGESLAFGQNSGAYSNVQDYKVVATGAHLSGAPVVSDECCAFASSVWASTVGDASDLSNLQAVYRGFAGGVNQVVWHGFPYLTRGPAGAGAQEVWPGMTYGGNASYSEAFGPKGNPNWADYRQVNDNVARLQLVLRQGRPRFDLAVYWQDFGLNGTGTTGVGANKLIPSSSALAAAGYTYEYLSPEHLAGSDAEVRDGVLFPGASAYHALLLNDQTTMPVDTARSILRLAQQGLPVVILGDLPTTTPGYHPDQDAELRAVIADLVGQPSVTRVGDEAAVPAALQRAGVRAAAAHVTPSDAILDVRRQANGVDYYYLFNQGATSAYQTLTLTGDGVPYRLDTWTGAITPISGYTKGPGAVTVPVRLAGHDATVIAVTPRRDGTFNGAAPTPGGAAGESLQPVRLSDWSLSVDSWTPGPSGLPGDTTHTAIGPVAVPAGADGSLPAWSAISPDLADASGIGTYTTHLELSAEWASARGAYLDLGTAVDTVRVSVNGRDLPAVDQMDLGHVDIGGYLRPGDNTITVRVSSTLLNAVRVAPGTGASSRTRMAYGLFGPVTVTPYAAAAPVLTVEALQRSLPLAKGGYNQADILVTNASARPTTVDLAATGAAGITATAPRSTTIPAGGSISIPLAVRNASLGSGASTVTVEARAGNGLAASTSLKLTHTTNLALNQQGTPFPRVIADASQDRYPAQLAVDGSASTFWVSWGQTGGQGPTTDNPTTYGLDFGAPVTVGSVTVGGRSNYGARAYTIEVSTEGRSWQTVAAVPNQPTSGATTSFPPVTARYLRVRITDTWDSVRPPRNVQVSELAVTAGG